MNVWKAAKAKGQRAHLRTLARRFAVRRDHWSDFRSALLHGLPKIEFPDVDACRQDLGARHGVRWVMESNPSQENSWIARLFPYQRALFDGMAAKCPVWLGIDLANGPDSTVYWRART